MKFCLGWNEEVEGETFEHQIVAEADSPEEALRKGLAEIQALVIQTEGSELADLVMWEGEDIPDPDLAVDPLFQWMKGSRGAFVSASLLPKVVADLVGLAEGVGA